MHLLRRSILLSPAVFFTISADNVGPTYPAPTDLTSDDSLVRKAWDELSSSFDTYLEKKPNGSPLAGTEHVTFSSGLFSLHDPAAAPQLQYHYTAPEIANSTNGTNHVDGDSIYGMASVSKLFTVFTGLLELTDAQWNTPLSDIIPGLAEYANQTLEGSGLAYDTRWNEVTPWALANQMAGVARQGLPATDTLISGFGPGVDPVADLGLPPVPLSSLGPCIDLTCTEGDYVESVSGQPPIFLPWTSPAYANNGFILLGIAISKLTGKPISKIYPEAVFEPLGMSSTFAGSPKKDADIAKSVVLPYFNNTYELAWPSGGLYSTINDFAKFGTALLNSTLLPADLTRKWMKPSSHTASLTYAVGAPWEIMRYIHPDTGKVTDIYTKSGDSGMYGGYLVLIPEYNAGFSLLDGSSNLTARSTVQYVIADYVANAMVPALEAQAAAEAKRKYAGTYVSEDPKLNSSLTIAINGATIPGTPANALSITRWVSNGTDVLAGLSLRLLQSIPSGSAEGVGSGKVAFQATDNPQFASYTASGADSLGVIGPFTGQQTNYDWLVIDATHYGGYGFNLFVFDVDTDGRALRVRPAVTRATLKREA
ncbi:hypothetical protein LTR37_002182 [Vermiconidia calcicola]|uniref:Uncharacterized protein n=1 Tax=Vermiconidia calcicola TaxID=1690605 RepID=A0ACC3NU57_9PEZI|nr:hypothetical protein LTR37_002182 [Vermiconidia calcicola]